MRCARATFYRHHSLDTQPKKQRPAPALALTEQERQMVIDTLHSDRICDLTPYQVYAQLLDDGQYMCSIRTMYRILHSVHGDMKERRPHVDRRHYQKPELLATEPNLIWSWDITKLKGPVKWTYY
jgi:putative transposase